MQTIEIPRRRLDRFTERAKRLARKADDLDVEFEFEIREDDSEIRTTVINERSEPVSVAVDWIPVDVTDGAGTFEINGWEVVARLDFERGAGAPVIVGPATVEDRWRDADRFRCDHCQTRRVRNESYVIRDVSTGEERLVGSTCVEDYLGHPTAERLAELYSTIRALRSEGEFVDAAHEEFLSSPDFDVVPLDDFLRYVTDDIDDRGYVSRSDAYERNSITGRRVKMDEPTADRALERLRSNRYEPDADLEEIADALDWAADLEPESDYEHNIRTLARADVFDPDKHAGFVASILPAFRRYKRELAREEKLDRGDGASEHVGEEGERLEDLDLVLAAAIDLGECRYSGDRKRLYKFVDSEGNVLCWFTTSTPVFPDRGNAFLSDLELERIEGVRATVKGHDEYEGTAQTTVSRVYFPDSE